MKECYLGIYWGKRKESMHDCTIKVMRTLDFLKSVDLSYTRWFITSKPQKNQLVIPINNTLEEIKNLLFRGLNYDDTGNLLESLGYLIYLKSDKEFSKSHTLSITCGSYSERKGNSVVLTVSNYKEYTYLRDRNTLMIINNELAKIWTPDKNIIMCDGMDTP